MMNLEIVKEVQKDCRLYYCIHLIVRVFKFVGVVYYSNISLLKYTFVEHHLF